MLETLDDRSALRSDRHKTPCLSANIVGTNTIGVTERELSNRAELRLRAVGISPVPFEKCDLPERDPEAKTATPEQMRTLWLVVEPYFRDDGTFEVSIEVFRFAKWEVAKARPGDDGFRGRLLRIESHRQPQPWQPRLRHLGRAATVMEAVDRVMDEFLVEYLRQNQR